MESKRTPLPQLVWKIYHRICLWCLYIAASLFFLISIIVVYEVIMRYFFNRPTDWVVFFSEFLLLIGSFLGAPALLNAGEHISITVLSDKLKGHVRSVWGIFVSIVSIGTFAFLFWPGALFCLESFQKNRCIYTPVGLIPKYLVLWVVPFVSLLLMIGFVKIGLQYIGELRKGQSAKDQEALKPAATEFI